MIYIFDGKTGAGKTYGAVKRIYQEWKGGSVIYSNIKLFFDSERVFYYENLAELNEVKNGIIFMDEAQVLLNARQWAELPPEFSYKLQQHRKHRLDFVGTTQDISRIDKELRLLIHYWERITKIFTLKIGFKQDDRKPTLLHWYKREIMDVEEFIAGNPDGKVKILQTKKLNFITKWSKQLYDTYSDVGFNPYLFLCSIKSEQNGGLLPVIDILPKNTKINPMRLEKIYQSYQKKNYPSNQKSFNFQLK